ncbi:sugar ABC transporter permease [Rhizobium sp. Root73]|uniref:ABC transporter permease n=1 Tax=Rhizobium sp. LjRoot98 TaxID=3342345 RepID=UPI000713A7C0|nr:sugar ABC transporter permease [Rhizobium sp. Root1204]KQY01163.1 sugar ABC transporter permease [Rhizobium sp. Root1334]KRB96625.1 sugar ABC transporter permease [Rhizobium sp. Root73]
MTTIDTSAPGERAARPNMAQFLSRYGTFAAFILLVLFNLIVTPNFLSWQTLNVNLTQVATIVIVAVGMTLVIATGGIDLSVGSLMAIAGTVAPMIFMGKVLPIENMGILILLSFILPVLLVMAFGWFNGVLVTRFSIQPIIATLVLFIAGRGIAQVATNGNLQVFKNPDFQFIAMGRIAGIPAQVIIMIIVAVLAHCLIRYTVIGRQIIAVGGNEKAARLTGIPVRRVKTFVYIVSGALAGVAGLIVVARNSASDANLVGLGMELDAIAAVAVGGSLLTGGRANIVGTVLGAFVIQLVRYTLLANGVPDAAALIVKAGLIVVAVFIQQRAKA